MKSLFPIIVFSLFSGSCFTQSFRFERTEVREADMNEFFQNYTVYQVPFTAIDQYVKGRSNGSVLQLEIDGQEHTWQIFENNMLHPEFEMHVLKNGTITKKEYDHSCRTFIGYRDQVAEEARFTITSRSFFALLPDKKGELFIQPLRNFIKHASPDLYVAYRHADVIEKENGRCSVTGKSHHAPDTSQSEGNNRSKLSRSYGCLELEVTMASDWRIAQEFDGDEDVLDFNVTVLNHVEHHFLSDFDLDYWVRQYFFVDEFDNNPWGNALEVDELQVDFSDWAYPYFSTEDIGHLWTAGDLHLSDDYGVGGYASVGGACDDVGLYPWALLERFTSTISILALLQAHEYGHLLDADHEEGTGTIMEPSVSDVNCACWASANIEEMWDFIEDETCIETCVQCPSSYNIVDRIAWGDWKYSTTDHINSTAYIYHEADVVLQSVGYVKLLPGFFATSHDPTSGGATVIVQVAPCE